HRFLVAFFFGLCVTFSGSLASPVSRLHSSNVSGEIFPFTSSSANLRRCALLLNGIEAPPRGPRLRKDAAVGRDQPQDQPQTCPVSHSMARQYASRGDRKNPRRCAERGVIRSASESSGGQ